MRFIPNLLALLLSLWAPMLAAQELPAPLGSYVNDYIDLLTEPEEAALARQLTALRKDHGVEMTVVLMSSRSAYGSAEMIEDFATRLFDTWGIGLATRNDGILFLVLKDDRLTRIELGKSYGNAWDGTAARILDRNVLPHFMNDDYARGLHEGTKEIIDTLALPHAAGQSAPKGGFLEDLAGKLFVGLTLVLTGFLLFGQKLRDRLTALKRCPRCGARRLTITRKTGAKRQSRHIRCASCDYDKSESWAYTASRKRSSGGSFGGGSSGGGGASGKW